MPSAKLDGQAQSSPAAVEAVMELAHVIPLRECEPGLGSQEPVVVDSEAAREIGGFVLYQGRARTGDAETEYSIKIPHELDDATGVIIVNGFGGIKDAYTELDDAAVRNHRISAAFHPIRRQGWRGTMDYQHWRWPLKLHSQAAWAVMKVAKEEHGVDMFDLWCHSLGGAAGTSVAEHHPGMVRQLHLIASAGLERHSTSIMARRVPEFLLKEVVPAIPELRRRHGNMAAVKELEYMLTNPARTVAEALAVSNVYLNQRLQKIRLAGIGIAALQFAQDHLFLLENVTAESADVFDLFEVYVDPIANHLAPQLDATGVAKHVLNMTARLNNRYAIAN